MTRNAAKIIAGIKSLAGSSAEIISGTVVPGSVDTDEYTISVQQSDSAAIIEGVALSACTGESNGAILIPAEGSNVIIGNIDGPGEWTLLKAGRITKSIIKAGNIIYEIDGSNVSVKNGDVRFNMSGSVFTISTPSESLFALLNDLITALTLLTVGTPSGASTVPVNIATFNSLLTRLGNLLSA